MSRYIHTGRVIYLLQVDCGWLSRRTLSRYTPCQGSRCCLNHTSFMEEKNLDYRRLVGQGYDGAATFSGCKNGVQRRIRTHSAHAVYIHCTCHRIQLASIQAAESITIINKMFGTMTNLWKLFYYSPKKAEALRAVQSVLSLPELKIVKPSSTRWLSHERCLRAIRKNLPALIITLQQIYLKSGDAEAYGISLVFSSFSGVASI